MVMAATNFHPVQPMVEAVENVGENPWSTTRTKRLGAEDYNNILQETRNQKKESSENPTRNPIVIPGDSTIPGSKAPGPTTSTITRDCDRPIDERKGLPTGQMLSEAAEQVRRMERVVPNDLEKQGRQGPRT